MNGLTLRMSKGGGKKSKNTSLAAIKISKFLPEKLVKENENISKFIEASNGDEQLFVLKKIVETISVEKPDEGNSKEMLIFLATVFFHAETKHPVKCFVSRYITKNPNIQEQFSDNLAEEITKFVSEEHRKHGLYSDVLTKLAGCIENFPAGTAAVKKKEVEVAQYLNWCLSDCTTILRGPQSKTLSPTEKNELFNIAHFALRLFLHIMQKKPVTIDFQLFKDVQDYLKDLLFDEDVPMDTKSVCGILYLTIHVAQNEGNKPDSWVEVLHHSNPTLKEILSKEASKLSLYSAVATTVAIDKLQIKDVDGTPAVIVLCQQLLAIGERSSSESTFILGVTRTLVQISKNLDKVTVNSIGLSLVADLLSFVWAHLEHYMDSVRHLTAQLLGNIVKYCVKLDKQGNPEALANLFTALTSLDKSRKSYYVSLTSLINEIGAKEVLKRLRTLIVDTLPALSVQAVQASAKTALEMLLQKHMNETNHKTISTKWITPILEYVDDHNLESGVLNIIEHLLVKAVKCREDIITVIGMNIDPYPRDPRSSFMLIRVLRKYGLSFPPTEDRDWKGFTSYKQLYAGAVNAVDETRILSLSLVVESLKTTEVFAKEELYFVAHFLKYNCSVQSPNFRQLSLSMLKKFIKRLEDSYKVFKKEAKEDYYMEFIEYLRDQCFDNLIPGANYSRRMVALQVLVWIENSQFGVYERIWKEDYVDKLLLLLEDSYENNKAMALDILNKCPVELLMKKPYSISLEIEDILRQASSMKPTDCVSAAYKLDLLRKRLPQKILQEVSCNLPEAVTYTLFHRLHSELVKQVCICERSIVSAAINAPMYGLLKCILHLVPALDVRAISPSIEWSSLITDIIETCVRVNASVSCVVNNSSPEGHLPMDMGGVEVGDHGNSGGIRLEDGRQVTAQMVLLCAWRSVKEVSLLLGELTSRLTIQGEDPAGTLTPPQLERVGEHFTKLLAETKHRGAFEQAYVGFAKLLARLWRCRTSTLHSLPRTWLHELMREIAGRPGTLCATRRGAGVPFMIQALVTTELQVQGNPKCFHKCMATLLQLARTGSKETTIHHATHQKETSTHHDSQKETSVETRTHCINILRALFRNSALEEIVSAYVGEGLIVALQGFDGSTWMERNSSTLLFSALTVRIFGVQRSKDADTLCVRNKMTGRIFFLRYPHLYDYMLNKLKEVYNSDEQQVLRPSLYPVLLLLARLYPSSLEGTVSNLKLVAYVPYVVSCARSSVLKTRQLAAKAIVPLISPDQYLQHLESMFALICDRNIKRNYCHGILLQLTKLIDAKPENLTIDTEANTRLSTAISNTYWILEQATSNVPCYLIADEYVKMINLILMRFPTLISNTSVISTILEKIIFSTNNNSTVNSGKYICLANSLSLYFILLNQERVTELICEVIYKSLAHESYEVILTTLNCLLILKENSETFSSESLSGKQVPLPSKFDEEDETQIKDYDNKFEEHLAKKHCKNILQNLKDNSKYIEALCNIVRKQTYLECKQKSLKLLTLEDDTEKYIVEIKIGNQQITDEIIIQTLIHCIENEHENLTDIYLTSLTNFVSKKINDKNIGVDLLLQILRVLLINSTADNSDSSRMVIVSFLHKNTNTEDVDTDGVSNNAKNLFELSCEASSLEEKFEYTATLYAILVTLLEDDNENIRQMVSYTIETLAFVLLDIAVPPKVISTKSAEVLRTLPKEDRLALFVVLALLDFKSEVCLSDEISDECRVFDQNERYNIYLEETIWTRSCADEIIKMYDTRDKCMEAIQTVLQDQVYRKTLEKLCNTNLVLFEKMLHGASFTQSVINSKIKLFVDKLLQK